MHVIVDCGNGAGSLVAERLFERLGVRATYLFCDSDGTFPNHHPDPTVPENLEDLIAAVRADKADLGVAFDGDADRLGVVDGSGTIIWGDHILILYARDVLSRTGKGQPIIFDVKCSQALPDAIRAAGGEPIMWRTGHSLIKEKMKETNAPIAGEMSGHMFFTEGFYGHDDALYGAARLLRIIGDSGRSISDLLADVPKFVSTPEIRVDCPDEIKFGVVERAVAHFRASHDVIDVDGARVLFGDGWGLIRASNTQPVLVLRFEARTARRLAEIRALMESWLRTQGVAV
jgi:phosphomannomutase / phosphoglucomutase